MIYLAVLPILGLLLWPFLYVVFSRPRYLADVAPPQETSLSEKITIIIPARNEEENLATLLPSINAQTCPPGEVIVVDDHSSDKTAAVAKKYGAQVISAPELPEGWRGKAHALHHGSQISETPGITKESESPSWLLFLDADLTLKAEALEKLCTLTELSPAGGHVHSIAPYHDIRTVWENASVFFNLLMHTGTNAFSAAVRKATHSDSVAENLQHAHRSLGEGGSKPSLALFGQSLLIHRNDYQKIGGHESVKNQTLENFHLARTLEEHRIEMHAHLGQDTIHMRMFSSFSQLWNSWKKAFTNGAANAPGKSLFYSSLWISGAMFTAVALLVSLFYVLPRAVTVFDLIPAILTLATYFFYRTQCFFAFRKIGSFGFFASSLWPLFLLFYQVLFFTALISKKKGQSTTWKGREVS